MMKVGCARPAARSVGHILGLSILVAAGLLMSLPTVVWPQASETLPTTYTVQEGDTLSDIAKRFYDKGYLWQSIYLVNKERIRNPNGLVAGWVLTLPALKDLPSVPLPSSRDQARPPEPDSTSLTLLTSEVYQPFVDASHPQQGILASLVRSVFDAMEKDVTIEFRQWRDDFYVAKQAGVTGTFPHLKDRQYAKRFFYSKPLYQVLTRAFVRRDSKVTFTSFNDFSGLAVCQPSGYASSELRQLADAHQVKLLPTTTLSTCLQALVDGQTDVVVVNELAGQLAVHEMGLTDQVCFLEKVVSIDTLHLLFPKFAPQSRVMAYEFDQMFSRLEQTGVFNDMISNHLKQYYDALPAAPFTCQSEPSTVAKAPLPAGTPQPPSSTTRATADQPQPSTVSSSPLSSKRPPDAAADSVTPAHLQQRHELLASVPTQPPTRQPGEFLQLVAPQRPPTQLELVSAPVAKGPIIDGYAEQEVWEKAPAITTLEFASQRPITLKSVHTDDELFFLVTFPDQAPSETHESWGWDPGQNAYKPMSDREDLFVFKWSMVGGQVNLALRNAEPHRADIWFWKAYRTNSSGYADDRMQVLALEPQEGATAIDSPSHGRLYLRRVADEGQPAYAEQRLREYRADYLPRFRPQQPDGSRADVLAKGAWHDQTWTIEFGRKLQTGHSDDVAFTLGDVYLFSVSCYEMVADKVAPNLTQPLYKTGDSFDRLLLKIGQGESG